MTFKENPDILADLSVSNQRPKLVVGFAAETENVLQNAREKRLRKNCDWILANDVSSTTGIMGGDENTVHVISEDEEEAWSKTDKSEVALRLVEKIATHIESINQ